MADELEHAVEELVLEEPIEALDDLELDETKTKVTALLEFCSRSDQVVPKTMEVCGYVRVSCWL